jgi:hypothetical protein
MRFTTIVVTLVALAGFSAAIPSPGSTAATPADCSKCGICTKKACTNAIYCIQVCNL